MSEEFAGHTPGPWTWLSTDTLARCEPFDVILTADDDHKPYGLHSAVIGHHDEDAVAMANRYLIAAAPSLLAERDALRERVRTRTPFRAPDFESRGRRWQGLGHRGCAGQTGTDSAAGWGWHGADRLSAARGRP